MNSISGMIQKLSQGWDLLKIYTAIKQSKNPKQLVIDTMEKYGGDNPMAKSLIAFAKDDDVENMTKFARNICSEYGADFDTEFAKFQKALEKM